jgi:CHASE3 domain sensor protein
MRHFIMALTIAVLLVGLVFYTLVQSSKQYDVVYQSNNSMIALHKLEYSNAVDDEY